MLNDVRGSGLDQWFSLQGKDQSDLWAQGPPCRQGTVTVTGYGHSTGVRNIDNG